MRIAVTSGKAEECEHVPEIYENSLKLHIIETDDCSYLASYENPGDRGLVFAVRTIEHSCEAIACGRFSEKEAFDLLASNGITRYYAAGLPVLEAALASDRGVLPLLTDFEGGHGCADHETTHQSSEEDP